MATANTQTGILSRVLDAQNGNLSPEAAKSILDLTLPEADKQRLSELSDLARDGTLDETTESELEDYRRVGRLLELWKSKARKSLKTGEPHA